MRIIIALMLSLPLAACGTIPPASDIVIGGAIGYALYGDEIDEINSDDLQDPKAIRDTVVPPRAKESSDRIANNFRDGVRNTADHVREWWFARPAQKGQPRPVPPSYCYRVMQDIMCYQKPVPGWEGRLVGYQGTLAMAPAMVKTKPLPRLDKGDKVTPSMQLKKAAPVFKEIPEDVKKKQSDADNMPAAAQETLPDPLMSPQL